jgi:hypothetical protein
MGNEEKPCKSRLMKNSLYIIIFLNLVFQLSAQTPIAAIESPELNILYRGYPNKLIPAVTNNDSAEVLIKGDDVFIEKFDDYYIVKPTSAGRSVSLYVVLEKNGIQDTIRKLKYRVYNIPDPILYWGTSKNSEKANIRHQKIFAKYPPEIALSAQFTIESWSIKYKNLEVSGKGNDLSSAEKFLKKIKKETTIEIITIVMGIDGVRRKIKGSWTVIPWKEEKEIQNIIIVN